eukprot:3799803-Amphidinium_carterae.2
MRLVSNYNIADRGLATAARTTILQTELDQARRQHVAQSSSLRNELTSALNNAVTPTERDQQTKTSSSQREEQLYITSQLQESTQRLSEGDVLLRTELASAQAQMQSSRIMTTVTTRANQRLEQSEASTREVEVLVARERDQYHEELLQRVTHGTTTAVTPTLLSARPVLPTVPSAPVATLTPLVFRRLAHSQMLPRCTTQPLKVALEAPFRFTFTTTLGLLTSTSFRLYTALQRGLDGYIHPKDIWSIEGEYPDADYGTMRMRRRRRRRRRRRENMRKVLPTQKQMMYPSMKELLLISTPLPLSCLTVIHHQLC